MKIKLIRNLKLTMLILAAFEIVGCNNVGSLETNKPSNPSSSKNLQNGTNLYDIHLLGDKAYFFSEGNKDNLPQLNSSSCLNPDAFTYNLGGFEDTEKIDIKYGASSSFSSLLADASISGGYSIFSAKAEASYADTSQDDGKTLDVTIFYEKKGRLSMNILSKYNVDSKIKEIIHSSAQSYLNDYAKFKNNCNTGYVRSVGVGGRYIGNLKLTFNNSQLMNKFKASVSASAGSFASLSASIENFQKSTNSNINVSITARTFGPNSDGGIQNIGTCIDIQQFPQCVDALNTSKNNFMKGVEAKINEIQAQLTVNSSRDEALMVLNALNTTADKEIVAYPPAILAVPEDSKSHDTAAQKELRGMTVGYYTSLGKLQSKLDVLRADNVLDTNDAAKLKSISDYLSDRLKLLQTSCFAWDTVKCRSDLRDMENTTKELSQLENKYDAYIEKTYYSTDKDIYFMRHTDLDNTIHLYPMIINDGYTSLNQVNTYFRLKTSFVTDKTYINPADISELKIKDGQLSYSQFTSTTKMENEAKCDVTESQIRCLPNPTNRIPPQIYKALNVTTDDIETARKKSFFESDFSYLSDSLEHRNDLNPTLLTTKPWCTDKNSPNDAPNCLQLMPQSLQFNGSALPTPTEYGYTNDSITIKHLTPKDTGVTDVDADVFYLVQKNSSGELKLTSLATVFSPTGTNLYYRLDPNKPFNFIGYPERSLANIANQATKVTEAQFASLLDQAKRDNQISFTRVHLEWMKGVDGAALCQLTTSGVCYGAIDIKEKAAKYSKNEIKDTHGNKINVEFGNDSKEKSGVSFESSDINYMRDSWYIIHADEANHQFFSDNNLSSETVDGGFAINESERKIYFYRVDSNSHYYDFEKNYHSFKGHIRFHYNDKQITCRLNLFPNAYFDNTRMEDKTSGATYCDDQEWIVTPWSTNYHNTVKIAKFRPGKENGFMFADDVGARTKYGIPQAEL